MLFLRLAKLWLEFSLIWFTYLQAIYWYLDYLACPPLHLPLHSATHSFSSSFAHPFSPFSTVSIHNICPKKMAAFGNWVFYLNFILIATLRSAFLGSLLPLCILKKLTWEVYMFLLKCITSVAPALLKHQNCSAFFKKIMFIALLVKCDKCQYWGIRCLRESLNIRDSKNTINRSNINISNTREQIWTSSFTS